MVIYAQKKDKADHARFAFRRAYPRFQSIFIECLIQDGGKSIPRRAEQRLFKQGFNTRSAN